MGLEVCSFRTYEPSKKKNVQFSTLNLDLQGLIPIINFSSKNTYVTFRKRQILRAIFSPNLHKSHNLFRGGFFSCDCEIFCLVHIHRNIVVYIYMYRVLLHLKLNLSRK